MLSISLYHIFLFHIIFFFFFFNDTATTEIYTLSLHERSSDLSCSFFALASAIATLATPSLKYSSSGTMVRPLRLVPPISLRVSCAWGSSLRERAGGGVL